MFASSELVNRASARTQTRLVNEACRPILGAGFAGLAVCWYLLKKGNAEVTLFDRQGPGAGASGASAGLLHPYTGPHARVPWEGLDAFQSAKRLITKCS